MKKSRRNILFFSTAFLMLAGMLCPAAAENFDTDEEDGTISLYASSCERIKPGEQKSSVRIRATDKASFKAVERISELSDYRNTFPGHEFNVLVYNIVDNYIEDLAVRTTKQNESELCVEVTGYLSNQNILKAFNENFQKMQRDTSQKAEEYPDRLEVETSPEAVLPVVNQMPPRPKPEIKKEIAAETILAERYKDPEPIAKSDATKVFIEKTKFFNNTSTANFYEDIKNIIGEKKGVTIVDSADKANYLIRSKVLRAKVDPINRKTRRLQLVIAMELAEPGKDNAVVEHQNRFILFESTENEQQVANELMKKLLKKAGQQILPKIKIRNPASETDAVITPTGGSYSHLNQRQPG